MAAVAAGLVLFGCTPQAATPESTETDATVDVSTQMVTGTINSGPVSVQDVSGNTFTMDKPASKVLATHSPTFNAIVVVGGGDKYVCGCGYKEGASGLYEEVFTDWSSVVSVGSGKSTNFEMVASLNPDVVVLAERQASSAADYGNIGLKTFVALPKNESFEGITASLTRIGALFGEQERVGKIDDEFNAIIKDATDTCASAPSKPSVMFMGNDLYEAATSSMIQTDIITAAGGTNAVQGDYPAGEFATIDAETVVKFNPDVIWVPNYAHYSVSDVLNDPALADVSAVKSGKVYMFPSNLEPWDYPTATACLGVSWGAYNLHPDLYTMDHLMKTTDTFYGMVYGKQFTAEQMGIG